MSSKSHEPKSEKKHSRDAGEQAVTSGSVGEPAPASDTQPAAPPAAESPAEARSAQESVTRIATLEEEIGSLRAELSSLNDKYLRKLADEANFRKRMIREKEDGQRFALTNLLGDLIPILDDFERAIGSSEVARDYAVLHDGIGLIKRRLFQVLESKYGLKKLDSLNQPFDPNLHEAVAILQGDAESGDATVAEEFLPAYCLYDRVLRTAKVRVRMPAPGGPKEREGAPAAGDTAGNPEAAQVPGGDESPANER